MKKYLIILFSIILFLISKNMSYGSVPGGTASMTLSPASGSLIPGNSTSIDIMINTGNNNIGGLVFWADVTGSVPSNLSITATPPTNLFCDPSWQIIEDHGSYKTVKIVMDMAGATPYTSNNTNVKVASLNFTVPNSGNININFNTTESMISKYPEAVDVLSTPSNSTYNITGITPSPSPSAQPTATPAAATLTFRVKFQGVGTPSNENLSKTVKVYINQAAPLDVPVTWVNGSSGVFTSNAMTGLSTGSVKICVKGPMHLSRCFNDTLANGSNTRDWSTNELLAGDTVPSSGEGFNKVEILDYTQFVVDFHGSSKVSDFNMDGIVNVMDYSYIVTNFGTLGDQ